MLIKAGDDMTHRSCAEDMRNAGDLGPIPLLAFPGNAQHSSPELFEIWQLTTAEFQVAAIADHTIIDIGLQYLQLTYKFAERRSY